MSSSYGRDVMEEVESGSGSGDWGTDDGLPDDDEDRLNGYDTGKCLILTVFLGRREMDVVFEHSFWCVHKCDKT